MINIKNNISSAPNILLHEISRSLFFFQNENVVCSLVEYILLHWYLIGGPSNMKDETGLYMFIESIKTDCMPSRCMSSRFKRNIILDLDYLKGIKFRRNLIFRNFAEI